MKVTKLKAKNAIFWLIKEEVVENGIKDNKDGKFSSTIHRNLT